MAHHLHNRELNKVIRNHAYPVPEVTETIRAAREQACESHRQDLENDVENPDILEDVISSANRLDHFAALYEAQKEISERAQGEH